MSFTLISSELQKSIAKISKFKSFNSKNYAILEDANEAYLKVFPHTLGMSGKSSELHKKQLYEDIKKLDPHAFRKHLHEYKNDCDNYRQQTQYLEKQKYLNFEDNWKVIEKNIINLKKISKLKKFWSINAATSHIPSETLFINANCVIPVFENFNQLANEELKLYKNKLSVQDRMNLKKYLEKLAREIQEQQSKLCDAMLSRLTVSDISKEITYDDVTDFTVKEMNNLGGDDRLIKNPRFHLSAEIFCYFHHYIMTKGSWYQQKALKKLTWMKKDNLFFSTMIDGEAVIIPNEMEKFQIPTKTIMNFSWFYRGQNFRASFFKDKFYLLAKIRSLPLSADKKSINLIEAIEGKYWHYLIQLEQEIKKEKNFAANFNISWFNAIFNREKTRFLIKWRDVMFSGQKIILQQKLIFAENLAQQLQTRLTFNLDEDVLSKENIRKLLREIIKNIDDSFKELNLIEDDQWNRSRNIFTKIITGSQKNSFSTQSNNTSTTDMLCHLSSADISSNFNQNNLLKYPENKLNLIYGSLIKGDRFDISCSNFESKLLQLEKQIKIYYEVDRDDSSQQSRITELNGFWIDFFVRYLKTCLAENGSKSKMLDNLKQILLFFSPSNIQERVRNLEKSATQSVFLYQTRCRALLFSFRESEKFLCDAEYANKFCLN